MKHREAVESDLMQTGYTLDDVGHSLSWDALKSFLTYARPDSALFQKINPDLADWSVTLKTNFILADIYDQLATTNAFLRTIITHKQSRQPEPYKRPGAKRPGLSRWARHLWQISRRCVNGSDKGRW